MPAQRGSDTITVVLVEDDAVDAMSVERALQRAEFRFQLLVATNGNAALAMLRARRELGVMMLLVDLNLPRMSGLELLAELSQDPVLSAIPTFVLSTSYTQRDVATAYESGIAGYLVKDRLGHNYKGLTELLNVYCHTVKLPFLVRTGNDLGNSHEP